MKKKMEGREYNMNNHEESLGFRSTIGNLIATGFFRSVYSTSSQRGQEEMAGKQLFVMVRLNTWNTH